MAKKLLSKGNIMNEKCNHKRRTVIYIRKKGMNHVCIS